MSRISAFPLTVLLFLLSSAFLSVQACPPHELKALLKFMSSTVGDSEGLLQSWKGEDCCTWSGVTCHGTQEGRHVSKLDLGVGGTTLWSLNGEMISFLFELKHLSYLDLSAYDWSEIPSEVGNLSSLRHLVLSSVRIPRDTSRHTSNSNLHWLSNLSLLKYLSLHGVELSDNSLGSMIDSLLHLHLQRLDLSECSLPGSTVPSALLNLFSLTFMDLSSTGLSNIPTSMGKLSSLTHLDLSYNHISNIPSSMGKLSSLTHLNLHGNNLGSIPDTIGNLTCLEHLDLSDNNLEGTIPNSIGNFSALEELYLQNNELIGIIPTRLGNLYKLKELLLNNNGFSGSLPLSFTKLLSLTHLDASNNQLSGSLHLSFAHLSSLITLDVSDNHLNGSIPSTLMLPSSLRKLDLSNNNMKGTITEVFFQKSLKVEYLDFSHSGLRINISSTWIPPFQLKILRLKKCQIGSPIPSWISVQFNLEELDLSSTQLTGNLPSWLWEIDIDKVYLSNNHLRGSFTPTSRSTYLDLSMNELSGRLQADIHVQLPNAKALILADNKFEGQIPTSIANLTDLQFLDMSSNYLTGNVPATLANLTSLEALNLENNYLEGEIPKELGSLWNLQSLRIGKNSLHGVLPSSLSKFPWIQVLDVGENKLTGKIPRWIANFSTLHVLVMRSNNFGGNLPSEIGRMPHVQVLDLSSNSFSGTIPRSYFKFPAMQNSSAEGGQLLVSDLDFSYSESIDLIIKGQELHYEYVLSAFRNIDLSNNRLSGNLSGDIENLKGLMYLNLSMNSLTGSIPDSLGNLLQLESLDLCFNKFRGQIPGEIGKLTYLAHLNLSYNNLNGRIPDEGGQMATFDESSYKGNPNLWGCPLERNCSRPGASRPPAGVEEKRGEGFKFPWYEMCFGLAWGVGFSAVVMVLSLKLSWRAKCFDEIDRVIEAMDRLFCML